MTSIPQAALATRRRMPGRRTGLLMAAEAATFALASVVHFGTGFTGAAIPELVIAAVLGLGSSAVLSRRPHAWGIATATTSFAAAGTALGLTIIATGRQDVPDLAYHAAILTALAVTLIALLRTRGDR
jgi:FtsH-binding integral membrane protein